MISVGFGVLVTKPYAQYKNVAFGLPDHNDIKKHPWGTLLRVPPPRGPLGGLYEPF